MLKLLFEKFTDAPLKKMKLSLMQSPYQTEECLHHSYLCEKRPTQLLYPTVISQPTNCIIYQLHQLVLGVKSYLFSSFSIITNLSEIRSNMESETRQLTFSSSHIWVYGHMTPTLAFTENFSSKDNNKTIISTPRDVAFFSKTRKRSKFLVHAESPHSQSPFCRCWIAGRVSLKIKIATNLQLKRVCNFKTRQLCCCCNI